MKASRLRAFVPFAIAFAVVFVVEARALATTSQVPREMLFLSRPGLVTSLDELESDDALREFVGTVDDWLKGQDYAIWKPAELVRHLRTVYEDVELEPALAPDYQYIVDETGVIQRICYSTVDLHVLPRRGESRVTVRLQRWMEFG